jgi:hypothetical protein
LQHEQSIAAQHGNLGLIFWREGFSNTSTAACTVVGKAFFNLALSRVSEVINHSSIYRF